jgi:hypothetical protein
MNSGYSVAFFENKYGEDNFQRGNFGKMSQIICKNV